MKACWAFVILTGCWMSTATQTHSSCTCDYKYETVCLPAGHSVVILCPELPGEVLRFNLLKNHETICSLESDKGALNCTVASSRMRVEVLDAKTQNKSISFKLTGVNASGHDVFRCQGTGLFPPPRLPPVCAVGKLLLADGHQCMINKPQNLKEPDLTWIWIVGLVSVVIYSVLITVCALFCWIKLKKTDSQSDYMNTKPRAPQRPRKNRGVQNPAPKFL